jgi:D-alanyl-lipoteichoic acid acyltransferase DltB (MBOAT superfamily)
MFTSLLDFGVGLAMWQSKHPLKRRMLLIASLAANLGLLGFFKYWHWMVSEINPWLVGVGIALPAIAVTLPPGISFYTFQTMSYTIEVYRKEMHPTRNIVDYMAFVTFWPHLVAGPIMRAHNLLRQLETVRPVITGDVARYAIALIAWGLFKKVVLADNFGSIVEIVDGLFKSKAAPPGSGLIFAYAFAGQIYCDFSAYTDIARGSAKLINVELIRNFHTPYFSASPTEFWRRWHISLSTWLRDYLYIPLGGNRYGRLQEYRNLMVTMVLGGLWHGAGVLFLLWGAWHGLLLVVYRMFPLDKKLVQWFGLAGKVVAIFITFHLICFGWILFRAQLDTVGPIFQSIPALLTSDGHSIFNVYGSIVWGLAILAGVTLVADFIGYTKDVEFGDLLRRVHPAVWVLVVSACYFGIVLLGKREGAQFIYFQF